MKLTDEHIKLIFGLKLHQLRQKNHLSLSELSKKSGLSVSYLNEIEKGKKYPKSKKMASLAEALHVSYDKLVSLKPDKQLAPVIDLLNTGVLDELPLDLFGIDAYKLIDLISKAPARVNAFITTLLEIARNYDMSQEHFYFAALRSYQELHDNYFEDIEEKVDEFIARYDLYVAPPVGVERLHKILTEKFGIVINEDEISKYPELQSFRSILIPGQPDTLMINSKLSHNQKAFVYGREIAYKFLGITERPYTFSWLKVKSFDQVLNNFRASYFAVALLINRKHLINDLNDFFSLNTWDSDKFFSIMYQYNASPEMFFHRLTNIVPKFFGLNNLFFHRINSKKDEDIFQLTKELHLLRRQSPHANETHQHYCRRWTGITILKQLTRLQNTGRYEKPVVTAQRSKFVNTNHEYFCISIARAMSPTPNTNCSVTIGFYLNNLFKKKVKFWNDAALETRLVGTSCEHCPLPDCESRIAPPFVIEQKEKLNKIEQVVNRLIANFTHQKATV